MSAAPCRWKVSNLLVAGRRVDGETFASTPKTAVVHVAARKAREFGVDIAAAIAGAQRDPYKRVQALTDFRPRGGVRFVGSNRPAAGGDFEP